MLPPQTKPQPARGIEPRFNCHEACRVSVNNCCCLASTVDVAPLCASKSKRKTDFAPAVFYSRPCRAGGEQ